MKKYFIFVAILALTPSIAFAAWWNPLSWSIFSFLSSTPPQSLLGTTTESDQAPIVINTSTTSITASTSTDLPVITKKAKTPTPVQVQTPQPAQPTGTLCNGTYWNTCPTGQNLTCPSIGNAYCETPQTPQSVSSPSQPPESSIVATSSDSEYEVKKAVWISIGDFYAKEGNMNTQILNAGQSQKQASTAFDSNNYSLCIIAAQSAASAYDIANQMNLNNTIPSNIPSDISLSLSLDQLDDTTVINDEKSVALIYETVCTDSQNGITGIAIPNMFAQTVTYEDSIGKAQTARLSGNGMLQATTEYFGTDLPELQAETND
jgi:hypothetical protein